MQTRPLDPAELDVSHNGPIWLSGQLAPAPRLAIVGARAARGVFRRAVPLLVETAGQLGWSVVSGGALGIDGDVHKAALRGGVPQLAVLPLGCDRPYPPDHIPLFERIAASNESGVIFARAPGTAATRGMFASRNKLVVALSDRVVVVQAALRSGSIRSGRLALAQGRPTAAIVGSPGAAALVAEGAFGLPFTPAEPEDFVARLEAWLRGEAAAQTPWPPHLAFVRHRLTELQRPWLAVDDFDDPIEAAASLVEAETLGLLIEAGPGRWCSSG